MGGAGWHTSKGLKVPPNIRIVLLPPYSPELNPVERLWQRPKLRVRSRKRPRLRVRSRKRPKRHAVRNRLHPVLESVMDAVERCLRKTAAEFFRSICRCDYLLQQ
jgi:transposase